MMKLKIEKKFLLLVIALLLLTPFILFAILWAVYVSLKLREDIFKFALEPPSKLVLDNYYELFMPPPGVNFGMYIINGAITAPLVATLAVLLGIPAGYGLSRFKFIGKEAIKVLILFGYLIPPILLIIPIYIIFNIVGLVNTRLGLIIALTALCLPGTTWFFKIVFDGVPIELDESAFIDGASRTRLFLELTLPIVKPALLAVWFFQFMIAWGDYLFPRLLITSEELQLPPVAITNIYLTEAIEWGWFMAASIIISLPPILIFLYIQKHFVAGWASILRGAVR
jgi:multiple sugar transport system permease protein